MKTLFSRLSLDRPLPQHEQIRQHIQALMVSGELSPGQRLPSTQELALLCQANVRTVHIALTRLTREGLLTRVNRVGTFVRKREEKLTCVGIYYAEDIWTKQPSDFQRAVHAALKEELDRLGVRTQVWVDPRPLEEQAGEWTELRRAADHREIQALISMPSGLASMLWLNKLPIPSAYLATANIPNRVDSGLPQLAELSLRCLAKQGCRSVGLICPLPSAESNPAGARDLLAEFFERFTDVAGDLGLTIRNEWMRIPGPQQLSRGELTGHKWQAEQEHYGYEEFLKLWSQPQRPEGLVVYPDTVARGVILGLREKQVRVPEDLKLVISKNESIPLLCPMPATFLVSSEREFARALIEQVQKQFRGEACEPMNVPCRLVAHPAAEQTRGGAHRGNSQGRTNEQPERERS